MVKPMTFETHGPYPVPNEAWKPATGRKPATFWKQTGPAKHAKTNGLYVFAVKVGPGWTPLYVGKADKMTFDPECLKASTAKLLQEEFNGRKRGQPHLFLIASTNRPGAARTKIIRDLEIELIGICRAKNPDLLNAHHNKNAAYQIKGVLNSGPGKPNGPASTLRSALGLG